MATYGFVSYKSDGTTVVLQNSSKSGVFGETYVKTKTGTAGEIVAVEFPQYTGRTLRVLQLKPGGHSWSVGSNNGIPIITFTEQGNVDLIVPGGFSYGDTTLYIFVK